MTTTITKFDVSPDPGVIAGYDWPYPAIGDYEVALYGQGPDVWCQPGAERMAAVLPSPYSFPSCINDVKTWACGSALATLSQLGADVTSPNGLPYLTFSKQANDGVGSTLAQVVTDHTTFVVFQLGDLASVQALFGMETGATRRMLYVPTNGQIRWAHSTGDITPASSAATVAAGALQIVAVTDRASDQTAALFTNQNSLSPTLTQVMATQLSSPIGAPITFGKAADNVNPMGGKFWLGVKLPWNALDPAGVIKYKAAANAIRQIFGRAAL